MKKSCKQSFTLLEILISMALLTTISSCFVYKGWDLLCEHRFLSSAKRVQNEITSAKLNALTYQVDLTLCFTKKGSKSELFIQSTGSPKGLTPILGKKIALPNLNLEEEIIFYSNGHIAPKENLILRPFKGKTKSRSISLSQIDRMKVIL